MTTFEKLRYLGLRESVRKFVRKAQRNAKGRRHQTPILPPGDNTIDCRVNLLGQIFDLRRTDRWHYSPDTGQCWPMAYSPSIPLDAAGDVKLVWELNRHQFLPALAARDPDLVRRLLRDWVTQNPCDCGINWSSGLEAGLRLIAWLDTFQVRPEWRDEFREPLAQHARFLREHLSTDWIPRNNHLIGEAAALSCYEGQPIRELADAAQEQFFPSGVHREQSTAYHHFVTHLLQRAGLKHPASLAYLAAIRQPDGSLPNIGDSDNAVATAQPLALPHRSTESIAFADAGHYVLRNQNDYCFVRCGEFGLPPNYGHAHADLLSPILWLRGAPLLVDAGTFTYNGPPNLRQQFRSAQSHNVLRIDGRNQAKPAGTFGWQQPPQAVCEEWTGSQFTGRLGPWQRTIQHVGDAFLIRDTVEIRERHSLHWRFHLAPGLRVGNLADGIFSIGDQFEIVVKGPPGIKLHVGEGSYSPSYNRQEPVRTCEILLDATEPVTLEITIR